MTSSSWLRGLSRAHAIILSAPPYIVKGLPILITSWIRDRVLILLR